MINSRQDLLNILNTSNLSSHLSNLKAAILLQAMKGAGVDPAQEGMDQRTLDRQLLDSVGPAAASAAVEYTTNVCRKSGVLRNLQLNGNYVHNVRTIQKANLPQVTLNDDSCIGGYDNWSNVLRQFLLPRYAYLDFDRIVDPRHMIDYECGYPKFITPIMYRYMYDRDDIARRVVDLYPDESWAVDPLIYEQEDETKDTPFEIAWKDLCDDSNIMQYLYRMDRLSGIGHYGSLLLGIDDGMDLEAPIAEPELLMGVKRSVGTKQRQLLYMRPFDEYLSFILQYETNVNSPRYGLPVIYNLVFLDMTIDAAGASIGTRLNRRVHWTRVVHVADNMQSSLVFGIPRQQPVFNRLLDLRKIKGGSAEMLWKGGFPGISFEVDPKLVADDPEFDKASFLQEVDEYSNGLRRYLALVGIKANSLAPQVADPREHVMLQMQAIASHYGVPLRIFLGSEESRLASSQDKLTWNQRLKRRLKSFVEPSLIRNLVDRLIAIGIMPPPDAGRYMIDWGDLNTTTDEDKANLALKWTQALSQYVATGIIHFMSPMDYMTLILGIKPSDAMRIDEYIKTQGGYQKLINVDPSQGAGVNGKRQSIADDKDSTKDHGGKSRRETADKQTEGSTGKGTRE